MAVEDKNSLNWGLHFGMPSLSLSLLMLVAIEKGRLQDRVNLDAPNLIFVSLFLHNRSLRPRNLTLEWVNSWQKLSGNKIVMVVTNIRRERQIAGWVNLDAKTRPCRLWQLPAGQAFALTLNISRGNHWQWTMMMIVMIIMTMMERVRSWGGKKETSWFFGDFKNMVELFSLGVAGWKWKEQKTDNIGITI